MLLLILLIAGNSLATSNTEVDGNTSRKVLGSSVVTSVSVVLDSGNSSQAYFADAVGKPVLRPMTAGQLASPINLLNPDRYEFYTFDDNGELVKRLMTLEEIQSIIANGDGENFNVHLGTMPEKKVDDVVNNVQNVLKGEIESHKPSINPILDTPNVSSTWSMILPTIFGNSGEEIKPDNLQPQNTLTSTTHTQDYITEKSTVNDEQINLTTEENNKQEFVTFFSISESKTKLTPYIEQSTEVTSLVKNSTQSVIEYHNITSLPKKESTPPMYVTIIPNSKATPDETTNDNISTIISIAPSRNKIKEPPVTVSMRNTDTIEKTTLPTISLGNPTTTTSIETSVSGISLYTQKIPSSKPISVETSSSTIKSTSTNTLGTKIQTVKTTLPGNDELVNESSTEILKTSATNFIGSEPSTISYRPIIYVLTTQGNNLNQHVTTSPSRLSTNLPFTTTEISFTNNVEDETPNTWTTNSELKQTEVTTEELTSTYEQNAATTESLALSVTELLDQLLQSTDIYAINSQLADVTEINTSAKQTESPNALAIDIMKENSIESTKDNIEEEKLIVTESNNDTSELTTTDSYEDLATTVEEGSTTGNYLTTNEILVTTESMANDVNQIIFNGISNSDEVSLSNRFQTSEIPSNKIITETTPLLVSPGETTAATNVNEDQSLNDMVGTLISQIVHGDKQTTIEDFTTIRNIENSTDKVNDDKHNESKVDQTYSNINDSSNSDGFPQSNYRTEIPDNIHVIIYRTTKPSITTSTKTQPTTVGTNDVENKISLNDTYVKNITAYSDSLDGSAEDSDKNDEEENATLTVFNNTFTKLPGKSDTSLEENIEKGSITTERYADTTSSVINENVNTETTTDINKIASEDKMEKDLVTFDDSNNNELISTAPTPSAPSPFPIGTNENISTSSMPQSQYDSTGNSSWTLIPVVSPNSNFSDKPIKIKPSVPNIHIEPPKPVDLVPTALQGFGLEDSTASLDTDVYKFVELCNELAFGFWQSVTTGISSARSVFTSPFAATSLLAMVFLGARGSTSGEMNEILKLDDMVTFNPHLIFRNVSESIDVQSSSGVATSAIVRELYSDRSKGKLLSFYKERARQFYDGHVEEASFKEIGDIIRRRTNLLVKRQTFSKIQEYVKDVQVKARPPLAGISASIFETDCSSASTEGRDGELYFVVLPTIRQRRLIPVPAVVYRKGFLAGYDPGLDATAVSIGSKDQVVSTIFVIPGQQGIAAPGDGLSRLENHLTDSAFKRGSWPRLLRSLIPRHGLEVQIPRFSHRSIINATVALQKMGLKDLFDSKRADLRGLNGVAHELHLSDLLQINTFSTCGEDTIEDTHHSEIYPATAARPSRESKNLENILNGYRSDLVEEPRDYQRAFHDPLHDPSYLSLPLSLRPRQARLPEVPRLRFDRPFLYFVRHNPTGIILHMGRFNPRLLP